MGELCDTKYMTNTSPTCCETPEFFVTSGVVRCVSCHTFFEDHAESAPRPGLVAANQTR